MSHLTVDTIYESSRTQNTKPSLNLKSYTGKYTDRLYGEIHIKQLNDGTLEISFSHTPIFKGKLNYWHYDTFIIDWYDVRIPNGFLTFNFNANREITGITLEQKSLLDVDFSELEIVK